MESVQQRALQRLYSTQAILVSRVVALQHSDRLTHLAKQELYRLIAVREHVGLAIQLLEEDPEVADEFQVELPF